jgi:hypothetical protein
LFFEQNSAANVDLNFAQVEYLGDPICASNWSILSTNRAAQPDFMYKYAQLIFFFSPENWSSISHIYSLQELKKALSLAQLPEKSNGGAGLILCNPHRDENRASDLKANAACMPCCWILRCLITQFRNSSCAVSLATLSSICIIHICILDSAILERLNRSSFTIVGVVGGSSSIWYSKGAGSEELSA